MSDAPGVPPVERRRFPRRWRRGRNAMLGLLALIALATVGYFAFWRIGPPLIGRISPTTVHVGETVLIEGQGFATTLEGNIVYFGDYSGRMVRAGRTGIEVEVPDISVPEGQQQRVPVKVQVGENQVSNSMEVVILPSLEREPGTDPLTEEEEEEPPLARPNPGHASPLPSRSPPSR
jgi:IPT/TIG domain-containing protein